MTKPDKTPFGLSVRDMNTFRELFWKYPEVHEVHLFGSRAKGNYKPGSDVDLAIINEGVNAGTITKLIADFSESSLPYTVDLVNLPLLKPGDLTEHIKRVGIVFYKREEFKIAPIPLVQK